MPPDMCPYCGYNYEKDESLEVDGFRIDPTFGILVYNGHAIRLTRSEHDVLYGIMKSPGKLISREALLNRLGTEASVSIINVYMCRIRDVLDSQDCHNTYIQTNWGRGYYWQKKPRENLSSRHTRLNYAIS